MATSDDWYRSGSWGDAERAEFDAKIKRARKGYNRAQYFWLKAGALFYASTDAADPRRAAAVELLERALVESECDKGDTAYLYEQLGAYQLMMGDRHAAARSLRACIDACGIADRSRHGTVSPEELLARCLCDDGDHDGARALFDSMYAWQARGRIWPPAYHAMRDREYLTVGGEPYRDPDDAAEAIVVYYHASEDREPGIPEVFESDRGALAALDRHFRTTKLSLERKRMPRRALKAEFLEERFVAELGAYIGRVATRVSPARWKPGTPLMRSCLVLDGRELDPFRCGYDAVYYEMPLVGLLDRLLAGGAADASPRAPRRRGSARPARGASRTSGRSRRARRPRSARRARART